MKVSKSNCGGILKKWEEFTKHHQYHAISDALCSTRRVKSFLSASKNQGTKLLEHSGPVYFCWAKHGVWLYHYSYTPNFTHLIRFTVKINITSLGRAFFCINLYLCVSLVEEKWLKMVLYLCCDVFLFFFYPPVKWPYGRIYFLTKSKQQQKQFQSSELCQDHVLKISKSQCESLIFA